MIPADLPRPERVLAVLERDGSECVWCRRPLSLGHRDLTVDHVVPRLKGGPAWAENEIPACRACNRARGHAAPVDWLAATEARGLHPHRAAIGRALVETRRAIARRGGQRKARPYIDAQLRRLGVDLADAA